MQEMTELKNPPRAKRKRQGTRLFSDTQWSFFGTKCTRAVNKFDGDDDDKDEESGAVEDDFLDDEFMSTRTLEETIMRLLDAGFTPSSPYVHEKLNLVIRKVAERFIQQFRIEVPGSVEVFCVPDLLGILEENEDFLECSKPVFPGPDGVEVEVLVGDILVGRYPCKLPTDVKKVKAVNKLELHQYVDVFILPVKGNHSLTFEFVSGDYDGSKASH
ncbi:hypothetical protein M422DRAFT_274445 [Sphaerobolus stellatus SS14]|uniref:RNA-dependent RNA polymerase n=1 Tax=Sphaerobolus stellatus (strain SS14) TaxID=990650 RepID=A0A0C9UHM3_SPHS4|nr:hypothetical protein M422DRAFT_274445 [Sphaerobolus stellatus SS14]